jgi:hypothetical protein
VKHAAKRERAPKSVNDFTVEIDGISQEPPIQRAINRRAKEQQSEQGAFNRSAFLQFGDLENSHHKSGGFSVACSANSCPRLSCPQSFSRGRLQRGHDNWPKKELAARRSFRDRADS